VVPSPSAKADDETNDDAEADNEADILANAKAMAVANILANAKFESDGSPSYIIADSEDDRLHNCATPVLLGSNLFLRISPYGDLVCPVCPNHKARG
jgi:hypothetical protein